MSKNVLILGRTEIVLDTLEDSLDVEDVTLFSGTSLGDVKKIFEENDIHIVIMGAGLDIDLRLQIIKHVFTASKSTTVHMKDWSSGPQGMLPFVKGILVGLPG